MRRPQHITSLTAFILSCACCALFFAACGQATDQSAARAANSNPTPGSPTATSTTQSASATGKPTSAATLRCTMREEPVTTDTVSVTLSCAVANAASTDTSFTVSHFSTGLKGPGHVEDATCQGRLSRGVGACTVTFILSALNSAHGSVTGELFPSHRTLGPVTPALGS